MKLFKPNKTPSAIEATAIYFGVTPEEVEKEIEEAIRIAWATDEPKTKAMQNELFPQGQPSIDEFITVFIRHLKETSPNSAK